MTRSQRPRIDIDLLSQELLQLLQRVDEGRSERAGGQGAPPGCDPRRVLAPGVPRVRPMLLLLSAAAARPDGAGLRP